MNVSNSLTIEPGGDPGQNVFNDATAEDAKKTIATKKGRHIDRSHITTLPGIPEMYKCNICEKVFRNKKGMCYHDACITGVKPYKCNICDKSFIKRSHFEYHERVHSGYKPFKCSLCNKAFPQKNKLNRHMLSHNQEKQFCCQKCDKRYSKKEDLRNHMSIHTGLNQYVCRSCGKAFRISANLDRHMHTHSTERPYVCELCTKSFKDKSLLIRHKKTHGKDRPFSCAHCNRLFLSKSELSRHLAIHTDVKPFSCSFCHTVFRRKDNLNRHIRHHHAENSTGNELRKPEKDRTNVRVEGAPKSSTFSSSSSSKTLQTKSGKTKKSPKTPESLPASPSLVLKPQAISIVNAREEDSRKSGLEVATAIAPTLPIPVRRPGELSNAVPVINGPIMGLNRTVEPGQRKKTFTYTEPIPLAEAVDINRRIEEKLYPQNSGSNLSSNYYYFRKHTSDTAVPSLGNNSESYNYTKPSIVTCNRVQIATGSKREAVSHGYSVSASDFSNSLGGQIRGKCKIAQKINERRVSHEKHEASPKGLNFTDRSLFSGVESANSVSTIQINKKMYMQEKSIGAVGENAGTAND